jgi:hypothetical protein
VPWSIWDLDKAIRSAESEVYIDPFVAKRAFDPTLYDFGLVFTGFGPHRTAQYRLVSAKSALIQAGAHAP